MQKLLPKFEIGLFWGLLFMLAFIPLYPKFPLLNVKGTFVAVRLEDFLIALLAMGWIVYLYVSRQIKDFFKDRLNQALLLFFLIGAISLFSAVFLTQTVAFSLGLLHYFRRVEFMILLPIAISAVKTKKQLGIILIVLSVVVFVVNIYALGQKYLNWPVVSTTNSEFSKGLILYLTPDARVNSTFAGHYDLAVFLVMVIVMIASLFFSLKKRILALWAAFLAGFSTLVLVMTAARLSFVAVLFGVVISFILAGKKMFIIPLLIGAIILLAYPSQLRDRLISTVTVNLLKEGSRYQAETSGQVERSRLNIPTLPHSTTDAAEVVKTANVASDITPGEPTDNTQMAVYRSLGIRFNIEWPRAIRAFIKNPFLGLGYSSLGLATDNDFLRSLGEVGLFGTVAFGLILIEVFKMIWRNYQSSDKFIKYFSAGVLSLLVSFVLNALFIDVFEASKVASIFWMILGVNLAILKFK